MPEKVHIFAGNPQEILVPTCTIQKKNSKKHILKKQKVHMYTLHYDRFYDRFHGTNGTHIVYRLSISWMQ